MVVAYLSIEGFFAGYKAPILFKPFSCNDEDNGDDVMNEYYPKDSSSLCAVTIHGIESCHDEVVTNGKDDKSIIDDITRLLLQGGAAFGCGEHPAT